MVSASTFLGREHISGDEQDDVEEQRRLKDQADDFQRDARFCWQSGNNSEGRTGQGKHNDDHGVESGVEEGGGTHNQHQDQQDVADVEVVDDAQRAHQRASDGQGKQGRHQPHIPATEIELEEEQWPGRPRLDFWRFCIHAGHDQIIGNRGSESGIKP